MIATVLLIFAAVTLGTFALFFAGQALRDSARLRRRLRQVSEHSAGFAAESTVGLMREVSPSDRWLARLPLARAVRSHVELSGVNITPLGLVLSSCAAAGAGFVAALLWKGTLIAAVPAALLLASLPCLHLERRKRQRRALFAEQLPDALTMVARSLKAGHSLSSAVELIGQELPEPAGSLFKTAYEQQKLGVRVADALRSLRGKVNSMDFNFFVTIIRINSETGGNLAEILEKLAETIRSRLQIRRQVQVYTAEGRLSGYVLVAMPVVVFFLFTMLSPGYMDVFFTEPLCQAILGLAAVGQVVGFLFIRKIVDIRI